MAAFEDLGIIGGGSANNPENEIEIIQSRKIIGRVIDSLNLSTSYFREGRIRKVELYGKNIPIIIDFLEKSELLKGRDTVVVVSIIDNNQYELKDAEDEVRTKHSFGQFVQSKLGTFKIVKNPNFLPQEDIEQNEVDVFFHLRDKLIDSYFEILDIAAIKKLSPVIKISLLTHVREKGEDFVNELIKQYNIDGIKDEGLVSQKTLSFIDQRLVSIGENLKLVQDDVKNYKVENSISGLSREAELTLEGLSETNQELIKIRTELEVAKWVKESLKSFSGKEEILPQNLGFSDIGISNSILNFNELVLQKNSLAEDAGVMNPLIIQYTRQIKALKLNLIQSISNLIVSLEMKLNRVKNEASKINTKIEAIPYLEREFIDIAREQEIISGLYSYLLKKREETSISLAVTVPNAKIIDEAYGSLIPVAPNKKLILVGFFIVGLLVPFGFIYIRNLLDTKIHSRKDIEELTTIPFLGDVPHSDSDSKVVINNDSRTGIAEAFRLIRTNLNFMLPNKVDTAGKAIFVTSTTSGEGKSFVSINLAAALSLSNKKVLLLGMDLRAPKVTKYLGLAERKGVTNYITNSALNLNDLKSSIPEIPGLDIISSGVIPPNPAELLLNPKIAALFNEVKKDYDYIIVDTAPVNLVADTLLVSKYADMTLYVSRANYLDKRMLNVAQTLYTEKKLANMAIVLNDTGTTKGYGYGYGYGYGNGYLDEVKKPWYKRIF